MLRLPFAFALLVVPAVAQAAQRSAFVGSFSRVRVQGPYEVTIATGRSPSAVVSGDPAAIDDVEVRADGTTLTVRPVLTATGPRGLVATQPIRVLLATPSLAAVAVIGVTRVRVTRMQADRVDLSVGGTGAIAVEAIDARQVNATVIGAGTLALAGKAARVRLSTNGPGTIDADKLDAGDLTVRLDGTGETRATARYNADVVNTGLGHVRVAGTPKCRVTAVAGGSVECNKP